MRVGVTGHRVLAEVSKLEVGIDGAFDHIEERASGAEVVVVSSLAEGADRLVVHRALSREMERAPGLIVPLPRPTDEYVLDFKDEESVREFEALLHAADDVVTLAPRGTPREEGYRAVADYLLTQSDVLVALWDGKPATNQVGTAAVVARARAQGLPLAWIHAGNRRPGTMTPTTVGEDQGTLTLERF